MLTGGRNAGRVGTIVNREKHNGSFDIIHVKDAAGHVFATRHKNVSSPPGEHATSHSLPSLPPPGDSPSSPAQRALRRRTDGTAKKVFVLGKGSKPLVSLPKGKGVKLSILEEQAKLFGK